MHLVLEKAVKQPLIARIDGVDYTVEFALPAVAFLEGKLGHGMRQVQNWFAISAKELPIILHAGLLTHHPEVTLETVEAFCKEFTPEMYAETAQALGATAWPNWTHRFQESLKESHKGKSPNAPSADGR